MAADPVPTPAQTEVLLRLRTRDHPLSGYYGVTLKALLRREWIGVAGKSKLGTTLYRITDLGRAALARAETRDG